MSGILTKLKNLYINARGFHTDRQLVVFESDDWGSIRMPSKATLGRLLALGDNASDDAFLSNDSLESEADLLALYEVLSSVEDKCGNHPIFTLNFAVANPDFDNIDYENGVYQNEPFYDTYMRYYGDNHVLEILKDGIARKLILPQLHCREHLNIARWMYDLKNHNPDTVLAFENKTMGVGASFHEKNRFGYMDAFNTDRSTDSELASLFDDAYKLFENTFGFKSDTFVASCYVWNSKLEESLNSHGIKLIQSAPWQNNPVGIGGEYALKRVLHYTGERNKHGQVYTVRNCSFEPAYYQNPEECVESCMREIDASFDARKPAIVCTHRFNYIGSINPSNRENNLVGLKTLLDALVAKYPDVEFVSSADMLRIIAQEKK